MSFLLLDNSELLMLLIIQKWPKKIRPILKRNQLKFQFGYPTMSTWFGENGLCRPTSTVFIVWISSIWSASLMYSSDVFNFLSLLVPCLQFLLYRC